ncbi:MAG: HigA family addiction module antitoxin [Stellaceae bacterium]
MWIIIERALAMARPAIHPGEILADELAEIGITPTELARQLHVPPNRISQIIAGKRAITGDTALRLGHWFRNSAQFWLNLQTAYDLRVAAAAAGPEVEALPMRPALWARNEASEGIFPLAFEGEFDLDAHCPERRSSIQLRAQLLEEGRSLVAGAAVGRTQDELLEGRGG